MNRVTSTIRIFLLAGALMLSGCSSNNSGNGPETEQALPMVQIVTPIDSTTVTESAMVSVTVDNTVANKVDLYVDGALAASDTTAPFGFTWSVVGYADGSNHQLSVRATLTDGSVLNSNPIMVTVDNSSARPAAVQLLDPVAQTSTTVTLHWQRSSATDFAEYRIYGSANPGVTNNSELVMEIADPMLDTLTVNHGYDGVTRYYRVYVYDESGLYSAGEEMAASTINLPPDAVTLTESEDLTGGGVHLTWTASEAHDFDHYEIRRGNGLSAGLDDNMVYSSSDAMQTSYVDQDIAALSAYCYRLYVFDTGGLSSGSAALVAELPSRAGLQAQWTFDEAQRFDVMDASGNHRDATRHNGAHLVAGRFGNGMAFDGRDDYAYFPPISETPPESLTVSVWAASDFEGAGYLVYHAENGEWAITVEQGDTLSCRFRFDNGQWRAYQFPISADTDWHHYAMVYIRGIGVAGYFDGDSLGTMATPDMGLFAHGQENASSLGSYQRGCKQNNYYNGELDEVRLYTRALSAAEIRMLSQQTK